MNDAQYWGHPVYVEICPRCKQPIRLKEDPERWQCENPQCGKQYPFRSKRIQEALLGMDGKIDLETIRERSS